MNRIKRVYPKISSAIFAVTVFWAVAGLLFVSGAVRPTPAPSALMTFFSHFGEVPVVGICILLVIIPRSRATVALPVCATVIVSSAIYIILKTIFATEPQSLLQLFSGTNYGFPSGHSINNAALYTMLMLQTFAYLKKLYAGMLLASFYLALTMMVGISRIVLGIHRPGDVLGGWLIGFVIAFLVLLIINTFVTRQPNAGLKRPTQD